MSYDTFSPPRDPDRGIKLATEISVLSNDFGDGYEQSVADGLNPLSDTLSLEWTLLTLAQRQAIIAFFRSQLGSPFHYLIPGDSVPTLWRCLTFDATDNGERHSVSAEFKVVNLP